MSMVNDDVREAIVNEYRDIKELLTENVLITRLTAPAGSICLWRFDVNAKSHYLIGKDDTVPKETEITTFWLDVKDGYPKVKPYVYYMPDRRLASINVFRNGAQCIDEWKYDEKHAGNNSSLLTTVQKTIKDIIHDPSVSRFDSMANDKLAEWQRENIMNHNFPTCKLSHVFNIGRDANAGNVVPELPVRTVNRSAPPALPVR